MPQLLTNAVIVQMFNKFLIIADLKSWVNAHACGDWLVLTSMLTLMQRCETCSAFALFL